MPCLIIPNESNYLNEEKLLEIVKIKIKESFKNFEIENKGKLKIEIYLLVFPLRDLKKVRDLFLEARENGD